MYLKIVTVDLSMPVIQIATNQRQAVDLSFGYTTEKLEFQRFENFISYSGLAYTRRGEKLDANGISLKIGYEF